MEDLNLSTNPFDQFDTDEDTAIATTKVNPFDDLDKALSRPTTPPNDWFTQTLYREMQPGAEKAKARAAARLEIAGNLADAEKHLSTLHDMRFDSPEFDKDRLDRTLKVDIERQRLARHDAGGDVPLYYKFSDFLSDVVDPQQYKEVLKQIIPGSISSIGTSLQFFGGAQARLSQVGTEKLKSQLRMMELVDNGTPPPPASDGRVPWEQRVYESWSPELRRERRAALEAQIAKTPVLIEETNLYRAGKAVDDYGKELIPTAPGYEDSAGANVGRGIGSMFTFLGAGRLGRLPLALAATSMGGGEALERAIQFDKKERAAGRPGLTQEEKAIATIWGVAPGATDMLPVEVMLGRLKVPGPLRAPMAKMIGRVGGQVVIEGVQEGGQEFLQNLIERELYNPEKGLAEGVPGSAAVGGAVGGVTQGGVELARTALGMKGRLGRKASGQPAAAEPSGPVLDQSGTSEQVNRAAKQDAVVTDRASLPGNEVAPEAQSAPVAGEAQLTPQQAAPQQMPVQQPPVASTEAQGVPQSPSVAADYERDVLIPQLVDHDDYQELLSDTASSDTAMQRYGALSQVGRQEVIARTDLGEDPVDVLFEVSEKEKQQPPVASTEAQGVAEVADAVVAEITSLPKEQQSALLEQSSEVIKELVSPQPRNGSVQPTEKPVSQNAATTRNGDGQTAQAASAPVSQTSQKASSSSQSGPETTKSRRLAESLAQEQIEGLPLPVQMTGREFDVNALYDGGRSSRMMSGFGTGDYDQQKAHINAHKNLQLRTETPSAYEFVDNKGGRWRFDFNPEVVKQLAKLSRDRSVRAKFVRILESKTPQSKWAETVGVSPEELQPHIDWAVERGILRRNNSGKVRKAALGSISPMIIPANMPETIPGFGTVAYTPDAEEKRPALSATVLRAAAKILPNDIISPVEEIKIAQLRREDQLLAIARQRAQETNPEISGMLSAERTGGSDGTELGTDENGTPIGGEGRKTGAGEPATGRIADDSQGASVDASGNLESGFSSGATQRIVRQESARLDADGNILVGRRSTKAKSSKGRTKSSTPSWVAQRAGVTETFPVEGYEGWVTAVELEGLDENEGNLARLTYEITKEGKPVGEVEVVQRHDGAWEVENVVVEERRKGAATRLYNAIEKDLGIKMSPSGVLSDDGLAFWRKRSPTSVQWHIPAPSWAGFNFSPAKMDSEVDRVKREIMNLALNVGKARSMAADLKADLLKGYRKERRLLVEAWGNLPVEARAAKDSMFALRGLYSPAIRAMEQIRQEKGTGEQFWKQLTKTPGVKKDELDWMGLEDFLEGKESITKSEVLDFMRAHQIKLDERVLGESDAGDIQTLAREKFDEDFNDLSDSFYEWAYDYAHEKPIRDAYITKHGEEAFDNASPSEIIRDVEGQSGLDWLRDEAFDQFRSDYMEAAERSSILEGRPLAIGRGKDTLQALGQTDPYTMQIFIAMKAIEAEAKAKGVSVDQEAIRVIRHEAVELYKGIGLFSPKEWALLERAARQNGWIETTGVRGAYTALYGGGEQDQRFALRSPRLEQLLIKEAIAEQYSEFHLGHKTFSPAITALFERIKQFIKRTVNAVRGLGFQTWEDVFQKIDDGEFKQRFEQAFGSLREEQRNDGPSILPMQRTAGKMPDSPKRQARPGLEEPSQNLADLIRSFNKMLDLPVRQGRLDPGLKMRAAAAGGRLLGQTNKTTGVIRLTVMQEIDTLAHEGGHGLEIILGKGLDTIKQQHTGQLDPLASPGPDVTSEGFAEWFRRYVTNPAASKRVAPEFEAAFEGLLASEAPQMLDALSDIRRGYQEWLAAPSGGAVASSIITTVKPGMVKAVTKELEDNGVIDTASRWFDQVYVATVNDLNSWKIATTKLLEIAEKNIKLNEGENLGLKVSDDPHKLLRMSRGAYSRGHMDIIYGVHPYREVNPEGPSLRNALVTAFGSDNKADWTEEKKKHFDAYLASRRFVQEWYRFRAGELSVPPDKFSEADHRQSILDYESAYPEFSKAAEMIYHFQNNMLRKKRDAGLITPETYSLLLSKRDYVPVLRDMSDRGKGAEGVKPRSDKYGVLRDFRGSQRDVLSPLESIAKDTYETAALIARNDALKALDALARAAGPDGGRFAERIPAHEMKGSQINIIEALKAAGREAEIDPVELQALIVAADDTLGDNAIATIWRSGDLNERGEPIVYLWEGGKRIPIRLADAEFGHEMLQSLIGFNDDVNSLVIDLLALPARIQRTGVTNAPDFILANFLRDQLAAWILTEGYIPFVTGIKGMIHDFKQTDVSRLYNLGMGMSGGQNVATMDASQAKREVLELRKKGINFTINPLKRDFWRMTEFSETGTRIGLFDVSLKRAKKDGMSDWDGLNEAAWIARDLIDFNQRGGKMVNARRIIPFFGAAINGIERGIRAVSGKVDKNRILRTAISPYIKSRTGQPLSVVERQNLQLAAKVWGKMVVIGLIGVALTLYYRDDPEYEEISDQMKTNHWLFKINGTWWRYPKPFELAILSNLFEEAIEYGFKGDPRALDRFVHGFFEVTMPTLSAPGIKLPVELATNYNFFSKRPIVDEHLKRLPPEFQFNAYASEFGKFIGKNTGLSPAYVDHFITGIGASYGREVTNAGNHLLPALGQATGGAMGLPVDPSAEATIHDYFILRRFTKDPKRGSASVREFWQLMSHNSGAFKQAANGYNLLVKKQRDALGAQEFLDALPEEERVYALLQTGGSGARAKTKLLHPLNRAEAITNIASGIRKEINLHRLYKPKVKDMGETQIVLSPSEMRMASDALADIQMREARNALVALGVSGWAQKSYMDTKGLHEELKTASPKVYEVFKDRLNKKEVPSFEDVKKKWPKARAQILREGSAALLTDLYTPDAVH